MKYSAPRGTRDILPNEISKWQYVESIYSAVCRLYAFQEIRIPTFEATEVFARGVGDSTDIVKKEMYTFLDKSNRSMTLRPEGTAGVVRSFIEQGMSSKPYPVRLYYNLNLFRYERVAKGRYREFHQFGAEAFGSAEPAMDIELISMLHYFFVKLGISEKIKLHINSVGTPESRRSYNYALKAYIQPYLEELCGDCQDRFVRNPMRIIDCKVSECHQLVAKAPRLIDFLDEESKVHFEAVRQGLDELGIKYVVDPDIVRGLDYYTRTVFEFISENVGSQGTICGGGRYDSLVSSMGGSDVPAVGFAIGVERLLMEIDSQDIVLPSEPQPDVYLASLGDRALTATRILAQQLRERGVIALYDTLGRGFKASLKYANKINAKFTLIIGDNEIETNQAELKYMKDGINLPISLADVDTLASQILDYELYY